MWGLASKSMAKTIIFIAIVLILIIGGYFLLKGNPTEQAGPEENQTSSAGNEPLNPVPEQSLKESIIIKNFAFSSADVTIKKETEITWINEDSVGHSVVSDDGIAFKSELLNKGEKYSFIFDKTGEYSYHCGLHPNMKAKIIVVE